MVGDWSNDSSPSRFSIEGSHSQHLRGLKQPTTKPVVGVGRFTSPDLMVDQIRSGTMDFIGAARPSIADPFLPNKIELGLIDDIREVQSVATSAYRAYYHVTDSLHAEPHYGGGMAPRLASRVRAACHATGFGAGRRSRTGGLGNRQDARASRLQCHPAGGGARTRRSGTAGIGVARPRRRGIRVVDYREQQLGKLDSVEIHRQSPVNVEDVLQFGFAQVVIATGAMWRADGSGRIESPPDPHRRRRECARRPTTSCRVYGRPGRGW